MGIVVTGATGTVGHHVVEQVTGRPPRTFAEWVAEHVDAFRG